MTMRTLLEQVDQMPLGTVVAATFQERGQRYTVTGKIYQREGTDNRMVGREILAMSSTGADPDRFAASTLVGIEVAEPVQAARSDLLRTDITLGAIRPLRNTKDGNPRWVIAGKDGREWETQGDTARTLHLGGAQAGDRLRLWVNRDGLVAAADNHSALNRAADLDGDTARMVRGEARQAAIDAGMEIEPK